MSENNRNEQPNALRRFGRNANQDTMEEMANSVQSLRTEADRSRGLLGFGRRILVPADEIHVVVGDGRHMFGISNDSKVFGQTADRPSRYWLNSLTQVIKLKTISFTVAIRGFNNNGVEALDNSKVSFRLWAHAVAKLNPSKAEIAAQRVGLDTMGLVNTITKVGEAELVATAATMNLQDIIAERQKLAEKASDKVNEVLSELGYDLALLTITRLDGEAYRKLVKQSEARVSKETSIATNREQVAELQDDQARKQVEAEVDASTQKKLAAERLEAEREVETATIAQQESLDIRRHEMRLKEIEREKAAASAGQEAELNKLALSRQLGEAEAEKAAKLKQIETEREAELRAMQQKRTAAIKLAEAQADAERLAMQQARQIERAMELTEADALRLKKEEMESAERQRNIALIEAGQRAEALKIEADAESKALKLRTDAQANAELTRAEAEATAAEKQAAAAKIRAEATRAEQAAPGLAKAEVDQAQISVAEQQVAVSRAEGLAAAEVARAQAEAEAEKLQRLKTVEIEAQKSLATLYEQAPVLVELEKVRMELSHKERVEQIRTEAQLKVVEAIAPSMKIHVYGNGGQMSELMGSVLAFSQGLNLVGEEVPAVGNWLNGNGSQQDASLALEQRYANLLPHMRSLLANVNPRMMSSLKVNDVVEQLGPVVNGDATLADALNQIKSDASFRVIGDMPVQPFLKFLGVGGDDEDVVDVEQAKQEQVESA